MNYTELHGGLVTITNEHETETTKHISTEALGQTSELGFWHQACLVQFRSFQTYLTDNDCLGQKLLARVLPESLLLQPFSLCLFSFFPPSISKIIIAFIIVDGTGGFQKVFIDLISQTKLMTPCLRQYI